MKTTRHSKLQKAVKRRVVCLGLAKHSSSSSKQQSSLETGNILGSFQDHQIKGKLFS
jgi:hypothetical protein